MIISNEVNENQSLAFSKKERKELRRQEKQNFEKSERKVRKLKKFFSWVIGLIVVGGLIGVLVWLLVRSEKKRPGEVFADQGREHIAVGSEYSTYNSNPPTSGKHYGQETQWGIYQEELPDEQLIHNLEHGGIWISYNNIDQDTKSKIEALAKKYSSKMVVTPRAKNDVKIAVASWTRLLKLDSFDEEKIVNFIKTNKNKSPESTAQ